MTEKHRLTARPAPVRASSATGARALEILASVLALSVSAGLAGCGENGGTGGDAGTGGGGDGSMDGGGGGDIDATVDSDGGGGAGEGGVVVLPDGGILLPDGAVVGCLPATCEGRVRLCGNCMDDDADGLIDSDDPDCLGPCDRTEDLYHLGIPGGDGATCNIDCYYDDDSGSGNDGCTWNSHCDPLEPDARCDYEPGRTRDCPAEQPALCESICAPITPNGCDCFGCCETTPGSGRYIFLGSLNASGIPTCTSETLDDDAFCHQCTPVDSCLNTCGECELCFGRDTLPPECFPPPPTPDGGFVYPDGAVYDGGSYDGGTPPPRCPADRQACGLPGDPECPAGAFCITGCCQVFG